MALSNRALTSMKDSEAKETNAVSQHAGYYTGNQPELPLLTELTHRVMMITSPVGVRWDTAGYRILLKKVISPDDNNYAADKFPPPRERRRTRKEELRHRGGSSTARSPRKSKRRGRRRGRPLRRRGGLWRGCRRKCKKCTGRFLLLLLALVTQYPC